VIILAVLLKGHIAAAHKVGTYTTELLVLDHLSLDTNGEVTIDVEERLADEKVGFLLNFLLLSVLNFLIRFTLTDSLLHRRPNLIQRSLGSPSYE